MMSIESNNINEDHEKTNTCSGEKRRESVNLLDMTDIPALQPNTADQSINIWQKTEPEQQRACSVMVTCSDYENLQDHHQSMLKMDPIKHITTRAEKQQQPAKIMPTRLPTPRRPPLQTQTSLDHLTNSGQRQVTPPVQMNPTPPSSPSRRRIRQTSIARLSKIQPPATTTTTNGKANRDLAEFDPLISPVKEAAKKSPSSNDASIEKKKTQVFVFFFCFFLFFFFVFFFFFLTFLFINFIY
jgi:hypothetical protein